MSAVRSTLISLALLASAALAIEENSPDLYVLYYAEPWLTGMYRLKLMPAKVAASNAGQHSDAVATQLSACNTAGELLTLPDTS